MFVAYRLNVDDVLIKNSDVNNDLGFGSDIHRHAVDTERFDHLDLEWGT